MASKLDELVASYGKHDFDAKQLKKVCEDEKTQIKGLMSTENNRYTSGGYTVRYSETPRVKWNEEQLLKVLKRDWVEKYGSMDCPYIKTREYVDFDELESVMYAGEISDKTKEDIDKCRTTTMVVTLNCDVAKDTKNMEDM